MRTVHQEDALEWLASQPVMEGCSFIASMPDFTEFPAYSLAQWKEWFEASAELILRKTPHDGVAIFYQRDSKHEGTWVDKAYLIQKAAEKTGHALVWHKIVCRTSPGIVTFGKPSYSHLLCFSINIRAELARSSTDLLPAAGKSTWPRGMGAKVAETACRFILDFTPTRTIVNPFCGHGMALAAANALGLKAIGIERSRKRAERAAVLEFTPQLRA